MKSYKTFTEGYIASSDKKPGKDGKLRPARHIKTTRPDDEADMVEKLDVEKAEMGDVIKDFQDSDAPQFKGKSSEKRRQMAIAAKMQAMNSEELKGDQHKLDKNKNGKLDADDFKKLSKESADIEGLEIDEALETRISGGKVPIGQHTLHYKTDQSHKYISNSIKSRDPNAKITGKDGHTTVHATAQAHSSVIKSMRNFRVNGVVHDDTASNMKEETMNEGTPDRLAMIRNVAQNVKKQKADQEKKAMRDAKRGMRSDADLGKRKDEQLVVEDAEMEKREMMKTQLHFIKYAADEIMEFVEMGGQIEEWYQNKVSKAFADFEGLHSYMEGTARKNGLKEGAGTVPFSPPYKKKTDKPNTNSDGSSTSPQSRAKQLAKRAKDNLSKTLAQHKEGVDFDSEGNILEAENKITFHQFVDATKKKKEKQDRDDRSTDINIKEISKEN